MLEKTLETPLNCKEIKPVSPKGSQPWIFIGRTDAEVEAPVLGPPDAKSQSHWKRPWWWERWRAGEEVGREGDLDSITDSMDMSLILIQLSLCRAKKGFLLLLLVVFFFPGTNPHSVKLEWLFRHFGKKPTALIWRTPNVRLFLPMAPKLSPPSSWQQQWSKARMLLTSEKSLEVVQSLRCRSCYPIYGFTSWWVMSQKTQPSQGSGDRRIYYYLQ